MAVLFITVEERSASTSLQWKLFTEHSSDISNDIGTLSVQALDSRGVTFAVTRRQSIARAPLKDRLFLAESYCKSYACDIAVHFVRHYFD